VLTAGGLTHVEAMAPDSLGRLSVVPVAPAAAHRISAEAPAVRVRPPAPVSLPAGDALGLLPPGYPARVANAPYGSAPKAGTPAVPAPPSSPVVTLQVTPSVDKSTGCATASVVAGPGADHTVDRSAAACPPTP